MDKIVFHKNADINEAITASHSIGTPLSPLSNNEITWLANLLSTYPGSPHGNSETRGLDSPFARDTYVKTRLDDALLADIKSGQIHLVILFGNAGDGKTAFLQHLAASLGAESYSSADRIWEYQLADGRCLRVNLDGSAAWQHKSANQVLDEFFAPFQKQCDALNLHIVAINNGKLLEWVDAQPEDSYLTRQLRAVLLGQKLALDPHFRFIDLNARSLVGGLDTETKHISTDFLDALLDRLLGGDDNPWQPCSSCSAQYRCTAWHSVQELRDPNRGPKVRQQLTSALQACHQRGEVHITARDLRATLSYIFFGIHTCAELHASPALHPDHYYQRAFAADSPHRQGELLTELIKLDPALESDPIIDRDLLKLVNRKAEGPAKARLAWARRRAYFIAYAALPIHLTGGQHIARFRDLPLTDASSQAALCRDLCLGIASLEDLPPFAFESQHLQRGVPLRLTPRTPTDTIFWVIKPLERFRLHAVFPPAAIGLEVLPTQLQLRYLYTDGISEEILLLGLELFTLLLELKDGVQLSGGQDGVFAHLKIFTQRLAQENAREMYGTHPATENQLFCIRVEERNGCQCIVREML